MKNFLGKIKNRIFVIFIDQLLYRFARHNVVWSGASLTYFLILSLFPFLIVLLNILSYTSLVRERAVLDMLHFLPMDIQAIIEVFLNDLSSSSSQGLLSVAAFIGLWTASSGVKAIIKAINMAYDYAENRHFLKLRGLSVLFTIALLLMIALVMISLILGPVLGKMLFERIGYGDSFMFLWNYLRYIIPLAYMMLIFALLYKLSPNIGKNLRIPIREVLPGAVFATIAWVSLSLLLSYYVSNFGKYAITYGSLGGVIVLLIWMYYSSIVIVLGGEINATLEDMRKNGLKVNPEKSAFYED
ncbi:YihY/virulence factor BrkB family protein [Gudongella oleilytica]|uniref:YihY/virulence factor BrkB family protein n=1 Tax=Gudongella oleilytica TaxID=1582259 RepID=UPI002A362DA1|nr:YihY/virulence factor BrkB family protein [Gudongella oleilytica]MDY0256698.1 YihY/virulence factor BrkB family protein [Gudongella oleilytica]